MNPFFNTINLIFIDFIYFLQIIFKFLYKLNNVAIKNIKLTPIFPKNNLNFKFQINVHTDVNIAIEVINQDKV